MKIGIDISPLQGPHRMRGIGSVIINVINNLPKQVGTDHLLVLFIYPEHDIDESVLDLLKIENIKHEVRYIADPAKKKRGRRLRKLIHTMRELYFGDRRFFLTKDLDAFIQMDQSAPLPRTRAAKFLVVYDLIPYVMETSYLRGYSASRKGGDSRKRSIKNQLRRYQYGLELKNNCRRADHILSISEHTKEDFISTFGIKPDKITVTPLGAPETPKANKDMTFRPYRDTSWGPFRGRPLSLAGQKYILYIGGIDPRRKMLDLFAAYNNLRARGEEIKLVLAGDILTTHQNIPNLKVRKYVTQYSYTDDILFLGFISEDEKSWLYENAISVVYPSVYEGFGLPVLEAMKFGTPVICYNNSSIPEVGGEAALYAKNHQEIVENVSKLIADDKWRQKVSKSGLQQASKFSWQATANKIMDVVLNS